jgi:hypothetical protein
MMTDITVRVKNSEQTYNQKFNEPDLFPPETLEKFKSMINTALKCVTLAEGVLSEGLDIEIKTSTLWQ